MRFSIFTLTRSVAKFAHFVPDTPDLKQVQLVFNFNANATTVVSMGRRWKTEYDSAGRTVAEVNPLGERMEYSYDLDGRRIAQKDTLGRITQFLHDPDGNQIGVIEPALPAVAHDFLGEGWDGTHRSKAYSAKNEVIVERDVAGDPLAEVRYLRDTAGLLVGYVNERGFTRNYAYNLKAELVEIKDALGNTIAFNRNLDGDVVAKGYSGAGNVSYQYDQNRRLTRKVLQAPGSSETSLFAYDAANQLTSRQADLGVQGVHHHDHSYDAIGRQVRYHTNPGMELFYTWDLEGKRTSTTVPETGYAVHTEYDANHRPIRQVDNEGDVWLFEYDAANRRTAVIYPDGSGNFTAYDMAGQVVEEWAVTPLGAYLFHERHTYDLRGNIIRTEALDERRDYVYNARNWLTLMSVEIFATGEFYFQKLDYDPAGNLIRQELRAPAGNALPFTEIFPPAFDGTPALKENIVITYAYNPADQMVHEAGTLDNGRRYVAAYVWDGAGNMVGKTVSDYQGRLRVNTMTWSAENRLVAQITDAGHRYESPSLVEGDGKDQNTITPWRTNLTGTDNLTVYDSVARHVLWEGSAGAPRAKYVLGPERDEILAAYHRKGNELVKTYTYGNFRRDILAVESSDAGLTARRKYLPTGVAIAEAGVDAPGGPGNGKQPAHVQLANVPAVPLAYGFQGKPMQRNGMWEFNNRRVDGRAGRFGSVDPLVESLEMFSSHLGKINIAAIDLDGLYTLSWGCRAAGFGTILENAMDQYVKFAIRGTRSIPAGCVKSSSLRKCLSSRYDLMFIDCSKYIFTTGRKCGLAVPGLPKAIIDVSYSKSSSCAHGNQTGVYSLATTLLHEMVHTCGYVLEAVPQSCECACSNFLNNSCTKYPKDKC
jgi:YD repeat-containing protein